MIPKTLPYHTYNVSIAKEIGVLPALLIHHFYTFMIYNQQVEKQLVRDDSKVSTFHEGKTWSFSSFDDLHEYFPEYSKAAIKKAVKKLKEIKIIEIGNFNKYRFDKTNWYTIVDESILDLYDATWKNDKDKVPFKA